MSATIISGLDRITSDSLVGKSVAEIIQDFRDVANIPSDANASVDGEPVDNSYIVEDGDKVVFTRPTGSKG